ncbi:hypothetical protein D3C76_1100780 [compost metagenome]
MLGGAVDTHLRRGPKTSHRCRIDDGAATLGQHQWQLVLHAQPHTLDVDAHDRVELSLAAFGQAALLDLDTGVVEGVIQTPVGLDRAPHQLPHIRLAGDVAADEQGLAAVIADQLDRAFATGGIKVGHHHFQALGGKCQCRRPANPRSTTGDQGNLAGKSHAHR